MKNTVLPRLTALLDQHKLEYVVENNVLQRVVRTKYCNFMSVYTPSDTENRVTTALYTKLDLAGKTWLEVIALLNKVNSRSMLGRFTLDKEQSAVFYQSILMNISAECPDDKLINYLFQKETAFMAMAVVLELFKKGELSIDKVGDEFVSQKKNISAQLVDGD